MTDRPLTTIITHEDRPMKLPEVLAKIEAAVKYAADHGHTYLGQEADPAKRLTAGELAVVIRAVKDDAVKALPVFAEVLTDAANRPHAHVDLHTDQASALLSQQRTGEQPAPAHDHGGEG